jgi:hypothetical protein
MLDSGQPIGTDGRNQRTPGGEAAGGPGGAASRAKRHHPRDRAAAGGRPRGDGWPRSRGGGRRSFGEFPLYTAVFASLAATQIVWAGLLLRDPSRRLLCFGALFNLSVVGLWVASRAVGVPIAPHAWVPESIGVADLIETAGEIVVVLALWSVLMSERAGLARPVAARIAPLLVLMLFLTALYGVGAHAG